MTTEKILRNMVKDKALTEVVVYGLARNAILLPLYFVKRNYLRFQYCYYMIPITNRCSRRRYAPQLMRQPLGMGVERGDTDNEY